MLACSFYAEGEDGRVLHQHARSTLRGVIYRSLRPERTAARHRRAGPRSARGTDGMGERRPFPGACRSNPLARPGGRLDGEQSAEDAEYAETAGMASGGRLSSVRC